MRDMHLDILIIQEERFLHVFERQSFNGYYCSGILHISNIARARIKDVRDVFTIGEDVKVMVVTSPIKNRIAFRYFFLCHLSPISSF